MVNPPTGLLSKVKLNMQKRMTDEPKTGFEITLQGEFIELESKNENHKEVLDSSLPSRSGSFDARYYLTEMI
jgi:Sec7-like guanine-nucleotide exchange factor